MVGYIFMVFEIIFTIIGLLLVGDGSNKVKVPKLHGSELIEAFSFPIHGDVETFT